MYFTINMTFVNYLDMLPNLTNPFQLIKDRTTYEQPLPINLNIPDFDSSLQHAPTNLKSFMHDYANYKEIFDLKESHVFVFTSSIISLISTTFVAYLFCKHKHIRTLVARFNIT